MYRSNYVVEPDSKTSRKNSANNSFDSPEDSNIFDCLGENMILIYKRWKKLADDFYDSDKDHFDITKVPDVYDNIKYDYIHNRALFGDRGKALFEKVEALSNLITPLEYGITIEQKTSIARKIVNPLMSKINNDLLWWYNREKIESESAFSYEYSDYAGLDVTKVTSNEVYSKWRNIKTRLYFTSASVLYSLFNTVLYGMNSDLLDKSENNMENLKKFENIMDLDYLSHIVFKLYENFEKDQEGYVVIRPE